MPNAYPHLLHSTNSCLYLLIRTCPTHVFLRSYDRTSFLGNHQALPEMEFALDCYGVTVTVAKDCSGSTIREEVDYCKTHACNTSCVQLVACSAMPPKRQSPPGVSASPMPLTPQVLVLDQSPSRSLSLLPSERTMLHHVQTQKPTGLTRPCPIVRYNQSG
ncbi:hypothetical protein EI94DRAFT_1783175 [Lactarius quietus]|nr:hypothetical protein EI94DRAFT_1783175 [Lactarius quietus]